MEDTTQSLLSFLLVLFVGGGLAGGYIFAIVDIYRKVDNAVEWPAAGSVDTLLS